MPRIETREFALPIALADPSTGQGPGRMSGYAARFGVASRTLYDRRVATTGFIEVVTPGAFARSLRERPDVVALFNHDASLILGRTSAGTLRVREDAQGLAWECDPPDSEWVRSLAVSIKRGDIRGCSFSFETLDDRLEKRADGVLVRTLADVDLVDVGPVTLPAYDATSVSARHRRPAASTTPRLDLMTRKLKLLDLG